MRPTDRICDAVATASQAQIVLLTPYTGDNLGDGAIQDSTIANIVGRVPGAQVVLSVLHPGHVACLHGVPTFPITGLEVRYYSAPIDGRKKIYIKFLRDLATWPIRTGRMLLREIRHIVRTYFLLRRSELLIVSGGGQIDDYWGGPMGHPYALLKWAILARAAGAKLVFLSVGVCALDWKLSALFVEKALRLADYRSYRDSGSKKLLANMKFTEDDRVMPDLAFSILPDPAPREVTSTVDSRLRIGINPIPYFYKHHWPKTDSKVFRRYFDNLVPFIATLLNDGHYVILFATDINDYDVIDLLLDEIKGEALSPEAGKMNGTKVGSARELLGELSKLDCAVVSRLHAAILSHLSVKPVLAISYDRKVTQYMADMEQGNCCLAIEGLRAEELKKAFDLLQSSRGAIESVVRRKNQEFRSKLSFQYDELIQDVQGRDSDKKRGEVPSHWITLPTIR